MGLASPFLWCLETAVRPLSWERAGRLGDRLGTWAFHLLKKHRENAIEHIRIGLGDALSPSERYRLAKASFRNLGRCALENLKCLSCRPEIVDELVDPGDVEETLQACFRRNRSVLIVTGHYSNWELFAMRMARIAPLAVLAKRNTEPVLQRRIDAFRDRMKILVLDRDDPATSRRLRRLSREGGWILGILMDQDTRVRSIFSPFLGVPARTPSGPAAMAVKGWFDVCAGFIVRDDSGRYRLKVKGPLDIIRTGDKTADIQVNTDRFNEFIGDQIRERPEQWVWIHRRWRHRPEAEGK